MSFIPEEATLAGVLAAVKRVHNRLDDRDEIGDLVRQSISASERSEGKAEEVRKQNELILRLVKEALGKMADHERRLDDHERRLKDLELWRKIEGAGK